MAAAELSQDEKVFRDEIKKHRGEYFVTYHPAQLSTPFASIHLVFPEVAVEPGKARQAMEQELEFWLRRYPVPAMVSAFDAKDDLVRVGTSRDDSHLIGFTDDETGEVHRHWRLLKDSELPAKQATNAYLKRVYHDIPFRTQKEVREKVIREARRQGRVLRTIVVFMVGVPVLIEIVALGVGWLGHLLAGISIFIGVRKVGRTMGWFKASEREKTEAEKQRKMEHYYYHCERNPDGFLRLKCQSLERETIEKTRGEFEGLRRLSEDRKKSA